MAARRGKEPTKEDVLGAYRRDALLRAAVRVFGARGFDCATMEQIAQEADVAKGTTYLYYRSKQSVYDAALRNGLAELEARTGAAIDRASNLQNAISAFMTARAEYFVEHRDFFRMYVLEMARQVTSVKPRASEFQTMVDRQTRRLEQAVARAAARGEIRRVDATATAVAIFDLTRGLVARRIIFNRSGDLAADVAFLSALIFKGLRAQGSRLRAQGSGPRSHGTGRLAQ